MDSEPFDTLAIMALPVPGGSITLRGDLEERHVTALGGAKGTLFAEMSIPYTNCVIAVVAGCFAPDLGRPRTEGSFDLEIARGFLSLVTPVHIRQVPVPSGKYTVVGRLYEDHLQGNPDLVLLLRRKDGAPLALLL